MKPQTPFLLGPAAGAQSAGATLTQGTEEGGGLLQQMSKFSAEELLPHPKELLAAVKSPRCVWDKIHSQARAGIHALQKPQGTACQEAGERAIL